ncbi:MAG: hypothetical protein KJ626_05710 [Verrucomicrobia bacterium]|nr:hypothetical protein [Verrucomicrobiota bacterium]
MRALPVLILTVGLFIPCLALDADAQEVLPLTIQVSPQALVLDGPGVWVTVHTDIPLSYVDGDTVELNGIAADSVYADAQGNLVAKFDQAVIEAIVEVPSATLVLTGLTDDGVPFVGADVIVVMENKAKK